MHGGMHALTPHCVRCAALPCVLFDHRRSTTIFSASGSHLAMQPMLLQVERGREQCDHGYTHPRIWCGVEVGVN
jgi:hypothetical protein